MKKYPVYIFLLSLFIQFSCTSELYIDTSLPAEVDISVDQWKVVVINRFNPELLNTPKEEIKEVYAGGGQEAFYGAVDAILEDSTYSLVHYDSLHIKKHSPDESLNAEQLSRINQQYPYHLLLSLDHFDADLEEVREYVQGVDGAETSVASYYLVVRAGWTLFDHYGTVLDTVTVVQEEHYKTRPVFYGILSVAPSFRKAASDIERLAWLSGYDYWSRLSPQPVTFMRPYYSGGKLKEAAAAMATEDWNTAIALLEPMAGEEKKSGAKAAYNLAVVYEGMGMTEKAKEWASVAAKQNNNLAIFLLSELEMYDN